MSIAGMPILIKFVFILTGSMYVNWGVFHCVQMRTMIHFGSKKRRIRLMKGTTFQLLRPIREMG